MPCITTNCPWQPYFFGRKGDPKKGFDWTYHFFWGLEDVIGAFTNLWNSTPTNKSVGGLFPNDADGNAWGDPELGFPKPLRAAGFNLLDPDRYQPLSPDFTARISAFKKANVEIVTGVMSPPDFATFWGQAAQQGFKPKIVTIGKARLFPSVIDSLGDRGDGLSSEIWWSPSHPCKPSLTGQSAMELCDAYTAATKKPWTQPIGFAHGLYDVAIDVLKRAKNPKDAKSILEAIMATNIDTIVGPVGWAKGSVKNVLKTPLVSGQRIKKRRATISSSPTTPPRPTFRPAARSSCLGVRARHCERNEAIQRRAAALDSFGCASRQRPRFDAIGKVLPTMAAILEVARLSKSFGPSWSPTASTLRWARARRSASSGRTARARPACST